MADSNNSNNSGLFSSLLGFGSNLITNLFNRGSNNKTNETNLKIAQMNNQWSEKMMQKQMDYNTDMWNKTNEYNSAASQRQRLEKAGLNPSLMMNGGNAGVAQGVSSPSLPSPSQATMQPNRYDFSGIGQAAFQGLQMELIAEKNRAEVNNLDAQADVARARAAADNAWTYEKLKETKLGRQFLESTFGTRVAQVSADYQNTIRSGRMMQAQTQLALSNELLNQKELAIFDAERVAGVANTIANTLLQLNQGKLTKQQIITEIQRTYKTAAEAQGLKISNDVARRSADSIVENAEQQARKTKLEGDVIYPNAGSDAFGGLLNSLLMFGLFKGFGKVPTIKGFGR